MQTTRRAVLTTPAALLLGQPSKAVTHYVRFEKGAARAYGILEGDSVRELRGSLFDAHEPSGRTYSLAEVRLLVPCEPPKILAVGLNY